MKKYRVIQLLALAGAFMFASLPVNAQDKVQLKGVVIDAYSKPLRGAVVSISGTTAQTDSMGQFVIEAPPLSGEIEIWSPDYYTFRQPLLGRSYIFAVLVPLDKRNYSEDLLKPFGSDVLQNKSSSLANIDKADFGEGSISVEQAIYNALPGLRTLTKSGTPGEGAYLNARGIKSFISNSAPLIVINNVPYVSDMSDSYVVNGYSNSVLNGLNPKDIRNITFLKGGEASIYGSLGANGVILIETDNATDQETKVEFYGQYGVANNMATYPLMKADDYKTYISNIALTRYDDPADVLTTFPFLKDDPSYYYKFLYDNNTNWQQEIYRPAFVTDNVLKIKGGDAIAMYDLSLGYLNQSGVIDNTDLTRYHARLNANVNISRKVDFFTTLSMAYLTNTFQEQGMVKETNPLLAALAKTPLKSPWQEDDKNNQLPDLAPIKDINDNIYTNDAVSNPLALVKDATLEGMTYDVVMNGGMNYHPNSDWTLTGLAGLIYNYNKAEVMIPGVTGKTIMPLSDGLANNTVRKGVKETTNLYFNLNASWNKQIDIHRFKTNVGWQMMTTSREFDAGEGRNLASDFYKNLNNTSTTGRLVYGYIDLWNWMNFFGRAEYTYNSQLSLGVNMAYDGASSTGKDAPRYQFYPSVNAAWHIKNMPGLINSPLINKLTLRAEYATTGNSNYSSMISEYYFITQTFRNISGIVRSNIPNTEIVPERTATLNAGLDASVFRNAVDLSIDLYQATTSNVILDKAISPVFGFKTNYVNAAKIKNTGVELGIQAYLLNTRNWKLIAGGTFSKNKNELSNMSGESGKIIELPDGSALISSEGKAAYSFYGFQTNGIYASAAEAASACTAPDGTEKAYTTYAGTPFQAGDVKFVDQNSDGIIDSKDRVILGDANPDFFGRFYMTVSFKNFSLSANFAYSVGNEAYNAVRREFESMKSFDNQLISVNRRWSREGQITDMPRAVYGDPMDNNRFSDRYIEDASFVKLKELTLSYSFKEGFIKFLRGGTFYLSAENLATWSKYLGLDPEFSYSYSPMLQGFDYAKPAQPMNVKLGFNLQF
ncbi:MAG: SusC/RagA family TonB-linked outer membrane protein [Bacteroidales bacterium]|nr:SusC/RagA family TonB-linked outer membrane protein [Bacteroidales bacterium]